MGEIPVKFRVDRPQTRMNPRKFRNSQVQERERRFPIGLGLWKK
jgi:hypothetical protein